MALIPLPANILQKHGAWTGTGFVCSDDLPLSDDEDEEQVQGPTPQVSSDKHVGFGKDVKEASSPSQSGGKAPRKGTGFVSPDDLPQTDEEDEDEARSSLNPASQRHVGFDKDLRERIER
eukprot:symbB.v1.2.040452.t1/scaffold7246.1/size12361/1